MLTYIIVATMLLIIFDLLAMRYGADSRPGAEIGSREFGILR